MQLNLGHFSRELGVVQQMLSNGEGHSKVPHRYYVGVKAPHPIHVVRLGEALMGRRLGGTRSVWCDDPSALMGRTKAYVDSEKRLTWHRIVGPPAPLLTLATVGLIKGRHETAALLHAVRIG